MDIFLLENSLALGKQNTYNKPSYNKFIHITKWYSSRIGGGDIWSYAVGYYELFFTVPGDSL